MFIVEVVIYLSSLLTQGIGVLVDVILIIEFVYVISIVLLVSILFNNFFEGLPR